MTYAPKTLCTNNSDVLAWVLGEPVLSAAKEWPGGRGEGLGAPIQIFRGVAADAQSSPRIA